MVDDPRDHGRVNSLPPGPSEPDTCNTDPPRAPRTDHSGCPVPCSQCGKPVPTDHECYNWPMCEDCLGKPKAYRSRLMFIADFAVKNGMVSIVTKDPKIESIPFGLDCKSCEVECFEACPLYNERKP